MLVLKLLYRKFSAANAPVEEPENSKVVHIKSVAHWNEVLSSHKTVVAKFSAKWCPPCKACIIPYAEWSAEDAFQEVCFTHIDVDEVQQVASMNGVQSMPTFKVFTAGKEFGSVSGWRKDQIAAIIKKSS